MLLVHILEQQLNSDTPADRVISVVSVDNASHIGNRLIDAYRDTSDGTNIVLTVLQNLWHARSLHITTYDIKLSYVVIMALCHNNID